MAPTRIEETVRITDPARCSLCGGPNACRQAARLDSTVVRHAAGAASSAASAADGSPCWCVERRFPPALLARAGERDGGASCVCRRCLEEAVGDAGAGAAIGGSTVPDAR